MADYMRFTEDTEAISYLSRDPGTVPCSRYGRTSSECAPMAVAVARIIVRESGGGDDVTPEDLEHAMGLVVNDHDDPALTLVRYGREHGYDPFDYLDLEDIERTVFDLIPHYYDTEQSEAEAEAHGLTGPNYEDVE